MPARMHGCPSAGPALPARPPGAGTLDKGEAGKAVAHAGYRLDPPAFDALFRSFDPDR